MTRKKLGSVVLGLGFALLVGTYFAWSFGTRSEEKAQYERELRAAATGVPAEDVEPNRTPALIVGSLAVVTLMVGAAVRAPFREPEAEMTSRFFGSDPPATPPTAG